MGKGNVAKKNNTSLESSKKSDFFPLPFSRFRRFNAKRVPVGLWKFHTLFLLPPSQSECEGKFFI